MRGGGFRGEFGATFFVEAAAGTGKTTELVGRIVGLVRSGAGILSQIVAVTFTEKAAGEMKLRLRGKIEEARLSAQGEERERLDRALRELELARIGTIHAFCTDVLHERPVEAGIDPLFEVSSEEDRRGSRTRHSMVGSRESSLTLLKVSAASFGAETGGIVRASSCAARWIRFASTVIFQRHGGAVRSSGTSGLMRLSRS